MHLSISIIYALLMVISMTFGLIMFPTLYESVQIPLIPLVGLGSWIFGKKAGLLLILPALVYSFLLSSIIYADISLYYEARGVGILTMIITSLLIGNIKANYDALKLSNINLDRRITERNAELSNLTAKLITEVEMNRIRHGQTLHDEIGQQLTGIQLYCASMEEQLLENISPIAPLVISIRTRAEKAHTSVRKIARMIFPVRMNETGLIPAVSEMASCINQIKHLTMNVEFHGDFEHIPDKQELALYRICQETAMCATTGLGANNINLTIEVKDACYIVTFQHNGAPWSMHENNLEHQLILYRLHTNGGLFSVKQNIEDKEAIIYRIPRTE